MGLLTGFLLRLAFGLSAGMFLVSPRQVSSGYFRNHLYVTLGLTTLAAFVARLGAEPAFWWSVAAAAASYLAAASWLYEKSRAGQIGLIAVAALSLAGALQISHAGRPTGGLAGSGSASHSDQSSGRVAVAAMKQSDVSVPYQFRALHLITSGLTLGITMAAMLLGHWYLNSPGMALAPLRKLLAAIAAATTVHAAICGAGLVFEGGGHANELYWWLFVLLRWSFGLCAVFVLTWMAWQTLKIPNTQSATGILYVAVIGVFVGETMSLLLSAEALYPV